MNRGVFLPPVPASDIPASLVPGARGLFSGPPLVGSLHQLEPEFDPTWRFFSESAFGEFSWTMHLAFLALASCLKAYV
jgi:hypothetical protein